MFGLQAAALEVPVEPVAGVLRGGGRVVVGAQLVDRAEHDLAVQLLDRHAVLDEVGGQVFQQVGIGGAFAGHAEVAGRIDQAGAEVVLPDAVDDDPHGDGLLQDVVGQFQASAAFGEELGLALGENAEEVARNFRPQVFGIAAERERQVDRLLGVGHAVHERIGRLEFSCAPLRYRCGWRPSAPGLRCRCGFRVPSRGTAGRPVCRRVRPWPSWRRVVGVAQFALEDFGLEVVVFFGEVLQAQAAVGAEVVVGDELVRLVGALLFLGAFERLGDDDFVLFVADPCGPA